MPAGPARPDLFESGVDVLTADGLPADAVLRGPDVGPEGLAAREAARRPELTDLAAFGASVGRLFADPGEHDRMGRAAHAFIRENYVGDLHLLRYAKLFGTLF